MVPDWYELLLLVAGAYRLWRLVGVEKITESLRDRLCRLSDPKRFRYWLDTLLTCPWCAGTWIAAAVWGLWLILPYATLVGCGTLAVMTGVGLLGKLGHDGE